MDHEIIEQVLYDLTGSTRRDPLRRITMTYALDSGEGEWMKTSDKVNAALREALVANHAVGLLAGTYDEALTITRVSDYLLHLLDYSLEEFREISGVSLGTLFGKKLPLFSDRERFASFQGRAEAVLAMKGGLPLKTSLYKMDTVREDGERIWILSVQVNWADQNLEVVTHTLHAGFWYTDYDEEGKFKVQGHRVQPGLPSDARLSGRVRFPEYMGGVGRPCASGGCAAGLPQCRECRMGTHAPL